jgi:FKBP-type peptidyl-prolyl cis-trans isomerase
MKLAVYAAVGLMLAAGSVGTALGKTLEVTTDEQKFSYALGLDFGAYLKGLGEDFDLPVVKQGIFDAYMPDGVPKMSPEEASQAQQDFHERQLQRFLNMIEGNKEVAEKFLEENKGKEGVQTTESGLQYKVIKEGKGPTASNSDVVVVHYRGTFLDGTEFDSSHKRDEPTRFRADQVIPGWTEALNLMNVGSVYELYLHPDLAYGDRGAPPVIQPGTLLKFEVELLEIVQGGDAVKE